MNGESNPNAKIYDYEARQILASTASQTSIAKKLGVSQAAISWIRLGKRKYVEI